MWPNVQLAKKTLFGQLKNPKMVLQRQSILLKFEDGIVFGLNLGHLEMSGKVVFCKVMFT